MNIAQKNDTDEKKDQPIVQIYRYSTILSYCLERFIDDNSEYVVKNDGKYFIFGKAFKIKNIILTFQDYIDDFFSMKEHPMGMHFTMILGTCYPFHNWKSKFMYEIESYKKKRFIRNRCPLRYIISDRKFMADEEMLNSVFDTLLASYIKGERNVSTFNLEPIRWVFINHIDENDLIEIASMYHSDIDIYPTSEDNLLIDINTLVFSDLKEIQIPDEKLFIASSIYEQFMQSYQQNLKGA